MRSIVCVHMCFLLVVINHSGWHAWIAHVWLALTRFKNVCVGTRMAHDNKCTAIVIFIVSDKQQQKASDQLDQQTHAYVNLHTASFLMIYLNIYTHTRPCGVRSLCLRFLNQFETCVNVSPVFLASVFFSSGVGYLRIAICIMDDTNEYHK